MGSMYNSDFYNRYAIYEDSTPSVKQRTEQLKLNALSRQDNMEQDTAERYSADRALFDGALAEIRGPLSSDSAAQSAYSYAQSVVNIQNLTRGGHMEDAYSSYAMLRDSVDTHRDMFMRYAATKPINKAEQDIQIGAMKMSRYEFDSEKLELPDGTTTTIGQFYRDGGTFKKFTRKTMVGENFSTPVVDVFSMSTDGLDEASADYVNRKKDVLGIAVNPVVDYVAGPHRGVAQKHPNRIQHSNIADYVNKEYDSLVDELGDDGLRLLITDAVDNRCQDGSAMMTMKYVRGAVRARAESGDPTDRRELVRRTLDELDRQMRSIGLPPNAPGRAASAMTDSARRLAMLTIDSVSDGGRSPIDFDDPYAQRAMQDVMSFVASSDNMRIPFLSMMKDNGQSFRDAAASYVRQYTSDGAPPQDNVFKQAMDSRDTVNLLFSGGCKDVPGATDRVRDTARSSYDPVSTLGSTSGNSMMDSLRLRMSSVLWGSFVLPRQLRGERADLAIQTVLSNPDEAGQLQSMLTREVKAMTGFSDNTASAFVKNALSSVQNGDQGGLAPIDLNQVMVGMVGTSLTRNDRDSGVDPRVSRELIRWFTATNTDDQYFAALEQGIESQLIDPVCGMGYKDAKDLAAAKLRLRLEAVDAIRAGKDPLPIYRMAARRGNICVPTGNWYLPDGQMINAREFEILAGRGGKDAKGNPERLPGNHPLMQIEDRDELLRKAFPEMRELYNVDLDELDERTCPPLRDFNGTPVLGFIPRYSFSSNPEALRAYAQQTRQMHALSKKLLVDGSSASVRSGAK